MIDPFDHIPEGGKHAIDIASIGVTLGALFQWLPAIASILTILWTAIRTWETATVQRLFGRGGPAAGGCDDGDA